MIKIWTRNYNMNFMSCLVLAMNFEATKILKKSFSTALSMGISGKTSFWMGEKEYDIFENLLIANFLKNQQSFKKYLFSYKKCKERFGKTAKKINSSDLKNFSQIQLAEIYKDFFSRDSEFILLGQYMAFILIEMIPKILKQRLLESGISPVEAEKLMSIVLSPSKVKAVTRMEEKILRVAWAFKHKKTLRDRNKLVIENLIKEYGWIPSMTFDAPLWGKKFFEDKIKEMIKNPDLEKFLEEVESAKKQAKKVKKSFNNLLLKYPKLKGIFLTANKLVDLKDERDEARRFIYFLSRPLFFEIALRTKLKIDEVLTLSQDEIDIFLKRDVLPPLAEINRRKNNFVVCVAKKKLKIYSGKKAVEFAKRYLHEKEESIQKEFSGIIASPGVAKGFVKLIGDKKDLPNVKRGDILVAITTHPDYLFAMRRAKAVITDEGGLTSHAAIVSREFKIPCIVGTKIATQVLKDGQLVEVDANKGVVKVIK